MKQGSFSIKYLGCPLTHSKRNKEYFAKLIKMVQSKLQALNRILLYRGKEVLIKSILQSIPIYIPFFSRSFQKLIKYLHRIFAKFFRNNKESGREKHWAAWDNVFYPKMKGVWILDV